MPILGLYGLLLPGMRKSPRFTSDHARTLDGSVRAKSLVDAIVAFRRLLHRVSHCACLSGTFSQDFLRSASVDLDIIRSHLSVLGLEKRPRVPIFVACSLNMPKSCGTERLTSESVQAAQILCTVTFSVPRGSEKRYIGGTRRPREERGEGG